MPSLLKIGGQHLSPRASWLDGRLDHAIPESDMAFDVTMGDRDEGPGGAGPSVLRGFVARPAWTAAQVLALGGFVKGVLLRDWAAHLGGRFGQQAVDDVRRVTGITEQQLPDAPHSGAWVRIAHQILLTRAIAQRWCKDDLWTLELALREDALRSSDRWVNRVLRAAIKPRHVLAASAHLHRALYDSGRAVASVGPTRARITWQGARFMSEPTWAALQIFAVRGLFAAAHDAEPHIIATAQQDGLVLDVEY